MESENIENKLNNDECALIEPTKCESGTIQAINKNTVHKICSGQVVLSLAVAVKELVENAVDAGATLIEVKLRDQGLESVEVTDNGCGVAEENLEAMTAKYHTSKLREFDDLLGVETFGFRGEALSSLCALTNMIIITRHTASDIAIKIELDSNGKITKRSPCSRSVGTTVTLTQLFASLPVRRRDFMRNIKKEFTKMCHMLQAYCLVSKGVRIICSNHTAKTGKTVVMQSHGSNNVLDNITAVFGARFSNELLTLKSAFEANDDITLENSQDDLDASTGGSGDKTEITSDDLERLKAGQFKLEGFISSCSHGAGRSTKERQYFFVNSRPCDPKNISKIVNDVYHRYNSQQYPFVFLNIITARSDVDVNLTPDKRQLLIHNEKLLLFFIKKSLINTFGTIPSQYKMQNTSIASVFKVEPKIEIKNEKDNTETEIALDDSQIETDSLIPISSTRKFMNTLSQWQRTGNTIGSAEPYRVTNPKRKCANEIEVRTLKMQKIHDYLNHELPNSKEVNQINSYKSSSESETEEKNQIEMDSFEKLHPNIEQTSKEYELFKKTSTVERIDCKVAGPVKSFLTFLDIKKTLKNDSDNDSLPNTQETQLTTVSNQTDSDIDEIFENAADATVSKTIQLDNENETEMSFTIESESFSTIKTTINEIIENLKAENAMSKEFHEHTKLQRLRFKSEINPNENKNAENELQTEITKKDFARMEIIGQFNLGFIIVKLENDLFIVDQHASDEKYNFETLQQTTTLQSQPLTVPQPLELTVVNEMLLMDNLHVFEKNGFKFEIDKDAPPMHKVRLLCKPFSKNWEFGTEDIDELIFMLCDAPEGTICRPSRIRAMFASRACRKSVMIGKALNKTTMRTLINHMGEIEQPWNCPHGRPTCRHLINIAMLKNDDINSDPDKNTKHET